MRFGLQRAAKIVVLGLVCASFSALVAPHSAGQCSSGDDWEPCSASWPDLLQIPPTFDFSVEAGAMRFTPRLKDQHLVCEQRWDFGDGESSEEPSPAHTFPRPGTYTVTLDLVLGTPALPCTFTQTTVLTFVGAAGCCDGSFALEPEKRYVVSAWVKEDLAGVVEYRNPGIDLYFKSGGGFQPAAPEPFRPAGAVIDGWQRIEEVFAVPAGATELRVDLINDGPHDAFFDDIRFFPLEGNMKSFVYDPVTLRLMAELDERNYAVLYEYEEEGALIRVKKETERGIFTIQESRSSTHKVDD